MMDIVVSECKAGKHGLVSGKEPFVIRIVILVDAILSYFPDILAAYPDRSVFSGCKTKELAFFKFPDSLGFHN